MFIRRYLIGREMLIITNNYLIKKIYRISKIEDDSGVEELKRKFSVRGKFF